MIEKLSSADIKTGIIRTNGEDLTLGGLEEICRMSPYGQILLKSNRFGSLQPDNVQNSIWGPKLGNHGNNFEHMPETVQEAMLMVEGMGLGQQKEVKLFIAAQLHDMHEADTGDIPHNKKTKKDREEEKRVSRIVLKDILYEELTYIDRQRVIEDVQEIAFDEKTELGRIFNAVELLGYTNAALKAWESLDDEESDMQISLRVLTHRVIPYHLPGMVDYSKDYPYLVDFLRKNHDLINDILEEAEICDSNWDQRERFNKAMSAWNEFNSSKTT